MTIKQIFQRSLRSWTGWVTCALIGLAVLLLLIEHQAHVFGVLPYLLLLLCPLWHFFAHRREHGDHPGQSTSPDKTESNEQEGSRRRN